MIRPATSRDVDAMADLADARRRDVADDALGFRRPAPNARAVHAPFLGRLVEDADFVVLVQSSDGETIDGFLVARIGSAPPPFGAGPFFHVDDFTVAQPELWQSAGIALLVGAARHAASRGAHRAIVVTHGTALDPAKTEMLIRLGFAPAAEWWVKRIAPEPVGAPVEQRGFEAVVVEAPPVYDPGGPTCLALDLDAADDLEDLEQFAAASSAVLVIVPVPVERDDVRGGLRRRGYVVAAEWYSGPVAELAR